MGEAGLIAQSATLFFYNAGQNVFNISENGVKTNMQIATIIIQVGRNVKNRLALTVGIFQVGLHGILVLAITAFKLKIKGTVTFYAMACVILTVIVIVPLHVILKQSPVLWIFSQVLHDATLVG